MVSFVPESGSFEVYLVSPLWHRTWASSSRKLIGLECDQSVAL